MTESGTLTGPYAVSLLERARRDLLTDRATCLRIIESGTVPEILKLRADLVAKKHRIDSQLSGDKADQSDEVAELIAGGIPPEEAEVRAAHSGDSNWRHRAASAGRGVETWLVKIKARLAELQPGQSGNWNATSIAGAAKTGEAAAAALNEMLVSGVRVISFAQVGDDLVVLASRPTGTAITGV